MAIPDYQAIMLPLLEVAGDNEIHRMRDAVELLVTRFNLTEEEKQELMPDGRRSRFQYNVAWSRTYLKKAGLLEDPKRGAFRITDRGRRVLVDRPADIDAKYLQRFDEFNEFVGKESLQGRDNTDPKLTPEEAIQASYNTLRNSVATDLLDQVKRASPAFFERLVVDVLVDMGYGGSRREAERPLARREMRVSMA